MTGTVVCLGILGATIAGQMTFALRDLHRHTRPVDRRPSESGDRVSQMVI
jgi:hypothetical protein